MRYLAVLYLATLVVFVPIDLVFLGLVAKTFFAAEVGDMLGPIRPLPAVLFYLLYIAGIVVFVGSRGLGSGQTLLLGALFGLVCYATFELTALALLRHWTWAVVGVDIGWGVVATAIAATAGSWIAARVGAGG
ncbi:MAG: DUF2177 family protein [Xanthobacteraceae bacterium]|nr:DUF2177 family protein [Xanthobacteraceae bacterium]